MKKSQLEDWMRASIAVRRVLYIDNPTKHDIEFAEKLTREYMKKYNIPFVLYEFPARNDEELD